MRVSPVTAPRKFFISKWAAKGESPKDLKNPESNLLFKECPLKKPAFRFRLPWLQFGSAPRPASQPARNTTNTPFLIAISESNTRNPPGSSAPSQTQPSRTEPEPSAPSRAIEPTVTPQPKSPSRPIELQITSRPPSPARATEPHVTSQPASPARATEARVTSQPASPARATEARVTSQPASPARATEAGVASKPPSPPRVTEPRAASRPTSPARATEARVTSNPASPPRVAHARAPSQPASSPSRATDVTSQPVSPPHVTKPNVTSQSTSPSRATQPTSPYLSSKETQSLVSQPSSPSPPIATSSPSTTKASQLHSMTQPTTQPQSPLSLASLTTGQTSPSRISEETLKPFPKPTGLTEDQETPESSKKLENSTDNQNSKPFRELKSEETKEVMQKTRDRDKAKKIDKEMLLSTGFRPLKGQTDKLKSSDKTSSQLRNKRAVGGSNEQHLPLQKEIKDSILKLVNKKMAIGSSKRRVDGRPMNVITLAGDNTGASMQHASNPTKKEGSLHIRRGYKTNPEGSSKATTDAGESSKSNDTKTVEDQSMKVYTNSNVQCTNNSVLSESSTMERSPGVHLQLPRFPVEPVKSNDQILA